MHGKDGSQIWKDKKEFKSQVPTTSLNHNIVFGGQEKNTLQKICISISIYR